jgi:glycogen synthase
MRSVGGFGHRRVPSQLPSVPVRVAMVSWEYPPIVVNGIATLVEGLAKELASDGHEVVVLSLRHGSRIHVPDDVTVDGVRILRTSADLPWIPQDDTVASVASANHHLVGLATELGDWRPDVIHVHDWHGAWAGKVLRRLWDVPVVATVHAIELGRHGGHLPPGEPTTISSVEWWLAERADSVICCSQFMRREVIDGFELDPDHVRLVPNGVRPEDWAPPAREPVEREPMVLAWGRVRYEKGFQALATAMALVRLRVPNVRCVIAGRGPYLPELQLQVDVEGVGDIVQLAGYVSDDELRRLLHRAGCAVLPSLYEPFGVVALEAMAAGAPVIAARTGGLAEIVAGSDAGLTFDPGNIEQLADRITEVLTKPKLSAGLQAGARKLLSDRYSWDAIARQTAATYIAAQARYVPDTVV